MLNILMVLLMQEIIEYKGWIVLGVFVFLFAAEHIKPAVVYSPNPVKRIIKNLSFWPVNIGLSLAFILPVTYWASQHALWERADWLGSSTGLVLDILILDIFIYWWHRAVHEITFFWRFHEVHHLDEHLDTTSAIRFHFGEIFFATFVRAAVVIVFAVPFTSVVIFEVLVLAFTLFHHSNMVLPARFEKTLSKIIITPSIHWVHHHATRKDTDSNYGTIFSFWDRLFHTKSLTERFRIMKIGVQGRKDKSFFKLLFSPFMLK
jgi:sterol desaturase/sphingolipid hydroxylase (fatty acid hydroxylase superfamily)